MSKQMEYRKQIEVIEDQLTKENKEYMGRINDYMMIASVFHRQEEAVTAQLLASTKTYMKPKMTGFLRRIFWAKTASKWQTTYSAIFLRLVFLKSQT
ncbi:hypothetical protein ACTGZQ_03065 [Streptococcus suis]